MADETNLTPEQMAARIAELEGRYPLPREMGSVLFWVRIYLTTPLRSAQIAGTREVRDELREYRGFCGFVASRITRTTGAVLDNFGSPPFHMTEFMAREGDFKDLGWSDEKRNNYVELLCATAAEHTIMGAGCGVFQDDYERALPADLRAAWLDPYYFCIYGMLSIIEGAVRRLAKPFLDHFIFFSTTARDLQVPRSKCSKNLKKYCAKNSTTMNCSEMLPSDL